MKTISIIIPVYNAEKYIERCLNSVINQTYDCSLLECILVDDCSKDNSYTIIKNYIENYQGKVNFKLIHHIENKGVASARNTGLRIASGDYIFLIDNDDVLLSRCFEILIEATKTYNNPDVIVGNCYNHRSKAYYTTSKTDVYFDDQKEIRRVSYNMTYGAFPWNKLIKRSIILQYDLFFEQVTFDDLHWFIDMLQKIDSIVFLAEETYSYEYIETSLSHVWERKLNETASTFLYMLKKAFNYDNSGCYVEHNFFMVFFFMNIYDYIDNHHITSVTLSELNLLRNKLVRQTLHKRHILVAMYDFIMYKPIRFLFYWRPIKNRSIPFRIKIAQLINKIGDI